MNFNISSGKKFHTTQFSYENYEKLKKDEIKGKVWLNIVFLFISLLVEVSIFWFISR